ncbi:hypothetical protein [Clostridium sardiniense]|uniref:hypothetical protein n=1 Tax=Clostridium sardiniense TaxID=29369 RepID=UPI003D33514F
MKKIFQYLPLAIIIIVTYGIIYFLTQNNVNPAINFVVMVLLVLITDKYYLTRFMETNIKVILKSFIWVFIISLIAYFIYNSIRGYLTYDIMTLIALTLLVFMVSSTLLIYLIFYKIAYSIKLLYSKVIK